MATAARAAYAVNLISTSFININCGKSVLISCLKQKLTNLRLVYGIKCSADCFWSLKNYFIKSHAVLFETSKRGIQCHLFLFT